MTTDQTPLTDSERSQLRLIRLERGWTYEQMASQCGVPAATLRAVLEGVHKRPYQTTTFRLRRWIESVATVESGQ